MKYPKVSVIVPVYNVERYIDRCMQSLLNQSLQDIEIIIVDDGSPDNCPILCDKYSQKDNRVKVVHKKNAGLGYARNSGLEIATGEYVAFIDSDDFIDKNMFEYLYKLAHDKSLDVIYCGFNTYRNNKVVSTKSEENTYKEYQGIDCYEVLKGMLGNLGNKNKIVKYEMSVWHSLYKLDTIKKNNITFCSEREFISEDIIFHIDLIRHCNKIAFIPERFYYYCVNNNSLSKSFKNDRFERHLILFNEITRRLKDNNYDFPKNIANNLFLLKIRYDFTIINSYQLTFWEKYSYVKQLMNHKHLRELVKKFKTNDLPFRYKIFLYLIKYRCSFILTNLISI